MLCRFDRGWTTFRAVHPKSLRVCTALTCAILGSATVWADDWPQWLGPQRDAVWRETGIVEKFPGGGPPVRWRASVGGGYAGPAVAHGRVYVMDRQTATNAAKSSDPFQRGAIAGTERVLCLEERSGKVLWRHEYEAVYTLSYPAGPRVTPAVSDGRVYTLGAEGHLFCLDASTGAVLWSRELTKAYDTKTPLWGFAGHPLLDGDKLICLVGGSNSTVVAFDKKSGKELWRNLTAKEPGYAPPTLIEAGGKRQLIIWHPESVNSLDPGTGKLYWTEPFKSRTGLSIATPRQDGDTLFITAFYDGSLMLRLKASEPGATPLWRSQKASEKDTDMLHSIISTPFLDGGHVYGVCSYGQLRCLRADTGERVWETLKATTPDGKEMRWANAFIVKNGDRFFLFNEKGDLIIAKLTPAGYEEISRAHLLEPTNTMPGRPVVWSHPAFADRCLFARNDREIICVDLAQR
jgi:outer membrane protein assembly factor BamB